MDTSNTKFLVWNPRGLNNPARRLVACGVVADTLAFVVCVSESNIQVLDRFIVAKTFGSWFDGLTYLPIVGTIGGIVVAWCSSEVSTTSSRVSRFNISI
jgi:hypothetical protein